MFGWRSAGRQATDRFQRLFNTASRELDQRVKAIVASHAAKGLLQSGATIKGVVRATSEVTQDAVRDALSGIATVTSQPGPKREAMLTELSVALTRHHEAIQAQAAAALTKIGLGADLKHAEPLFAAERERHRELISDFREGWTAPATKTWKERHPVLFATITAFIAAAVALAVGWVGKTLIEDPSPRGEPRAAAIAPAALDAAAKQGPQPQQSGKAR